MGIASGTTLIVPDSISLVEIGGGKALFKKSMTIM
jgi:hypothetical protein